MILGAFSDDKNRFFKHLSFSLDLGGLIVFTNKKSVFSLILFVFFSGIHLDLLLANVSVPATCINNFKDIEDLIFFGNSSVLTYCPCNNDSLEYGYAQFYTSLDPLPCNGSCRSGCLGSVLTPYPPDFNITSRKLILSGNIGKDEFFVSSGGNSFDKAGNHTVGYLEGIKIGNLGREVKEGKVDFTYIQLTKQAYSSGCACYWDGGTATMCTGDDCVGWYSDEKPMFMLKGTFTVVKNSREDFDLFSILFDPSASLKGMCNFSPISYESDDEPFSRSYDQGTWNYDTCSCDENIITQHDSLISVDKVTHRVKVPGWEKDVWIGDSFDGQGLPVYMATEGWGCNAQEKYVSLDLGSFGKFYFHSDTPSDNTSQPGSYMISSVELCQQDQMPGEGEILWRFDYDEDTNGQKHLSYIYNGTDPNYPKQSPQYYELTWNAAYDQVQQEYYNTSIDQNSPLRKWTVSFDAQGRVIESADGTGCTSGCGGGQTGYSKVEYYDDFEDYDHLVKKQYNANGDVIVQNDYQVFRHGEYWPENSVSVLNASFEMPDVDYGYYEEGSPQSWQQTNDPNNGSVQVYEPNDIQWSSRYDSGESVPDRNQVLTLMGGTIRQPIDDVGIVRDTTYFLEVDTGAFIDPNMSEVTIKLIAYDPKDSNRVNDVTLAVIDVDENSEPNDFGTQLDEGKWVTQAALWDSSDDLDKSGWLFEVEIEGNYVDIDNVILNAQTFIGGETKPLLVSQSADPNTPGEADIQIVSWDYDSDNSTAVEKRWIDNQTARVIKYQYEDDTFSQILSKTEYENLNENPDDPNGLSYTTYYQWGTGTDPNDSVYSVIYPSGKRKDVEKRQSGLVVESYTENIQTGKKVNLQSYTYTGNSDILSHTDARGGITEYSYDGNGMMSEQKDPETAAGQRITRYSYDDARRMEYEEHQDSEGTWIRTSYNYNETTGFLDSAVRDSDYYAHVGKKITTRYTYNDFGQVIRETSPDSVVTGKTYGLGSELKSEFVIAAGCDPNQADPNLVLVSQTWYMYDDDGRIEYVKKVKFDDTFSYGNPEDANNTLQWIATQYEYDFLGRKKAVIEDVDGLALKTEYEYNNQGEVEKVTLPGGKWTETYRNGRGMVIMQVVGHDDLDSNKWQVTEFEYDADGNLYKQIAPDETSTIYEYDNFGRLEKVKRGITG